MRFLYDIFYLIIISMGVIGLAWFIIDPFISIIMKKH